jgi:hypothetical protein
MSTPLVYNAAPLFDCDRGQIIKWGNCWYSKRQRVWVDVGKLEANFQLDTGFYVGFLGRHGIDGRYEGVDQFLASGGRLDMVKVNVGTKDAHRVVSIYDGRHRFAWMRDHGAQALPVAAPIGEAREIRRLIGSKARICRVTPFLVTPHHAHCKTDDSAWLDAGLGRAVQGTEFAATAGRQPLHDSQS